MALTKEFVKLMKGTIGVKSEVGKGTTFSVLLPIHKIATPNPDFSKLDPIIPIADGLLDTVVPDAINLTATARNEKPLLLLIEDNALIIVYIRSLLEKEYHLFWEINGQLGIDKALEIIPDIIISDVMMPLKNGFEVTQTLKNDERTSHIPIILLTAKADVASKIIGLEWGADAYLAKPFRPKELQVRLANMITLRQKLQAYYTGDSAQIANKTNKGLSTPLLEKKIQNETVFLLKIDNILEQYLMDSNFGVAQLCQKLYTSQSQLYRKVKALTNKSTVAYIRNYRLHKAKTLLEKSEISVTDVAYEVGFSDPFYFSRLFSEEFGYSPKKNRN